MTSLEHIENRPFGLGPYPEKSLEFFNWGAFAQPLFWGVVYGVWPVVIGSLVAEMIPYIILIALPKMYADSLSVTFALTALSQVLVGGVRIWSGMRANRLVWARESLLISLVKGGKPRWSCGRFLSRQRIWAQWGLALYALAAVASAFVNYEVLIERGQSIAMYAAAQAIFWLIAVSAAAVWISRQSDIVVHKVNSAEALSNRLIGSDGADYAGDSVHRAGSVSIERIPVAERIVLLDENIVPSLGFGTYKCAPGDETLSAVKAALTAGYRHIDTASMYQNERSIGQAIRESGLDRDELFITSKVWNDQYGYAKTIFACEESLLHLGVEYLDLYLIHWPVKHKLESTWRALEHLQIAGKVRSIGVCNFEQSHLETLMKTATVTPVVNQIELHPKYQRVDLVEYCASRGISIEAWAPLMRGGVFEIPELCEIGTTHDKSAGQVALRWAIQKGYVVLPKSINPERIASNADIFNFELSQSDMAIIDSLDAGERIGPDPNTYSWEWPKSSRN